jgi:hypothetical protein
MAAGCVMSSSLAWVMAAQAQSINKCRIDGQLVLQSSPCPLDARPGVRAVLIEARVLPGVPHKRTLAEILRARDGGDPPPSHSVQGDGANVLRTRMGAV